MELLLILKTNFNQLKLNYVIDKINDGENFYEIYKNLNLKDVILFTIIAWENIKKVSINNCFKHLSNNKDSIIKADIVEIYNYNESIKQINIIDPIDQKEFLNIGFTEQDVLLHDLENEEEIDMINIDNNSNEKLNYDNSKNQQKNVKKIINK